MTIETFQRIVWRLANSCYVHTFLALDHPSPATRMGVQIVSYEGMGRRRKLAVTAAGKGLAEELTRLGFVWDEGLQMWTVNREEGA